MSFVCTAINFLSRNGQTGIAGNIHIRDDQMKGLDSAFLLAFLIFRAKGYTDTTYLQGKIPKCFIHFFNFISSNSKSFYILPNSFVIYMGKRQNSMTIL